MTIGRWAWLGCLLLLAYGLAGCKKTKPPAAPVPGVEVAKPVPRTITNKVVFTGKVAAVQSVDLRARVRGFLKEVCFKDGEEVQAGRKLFEIEKGPYEAAVNEAKANLSLAQAAAENADNNFTRIKEAFDKQVATEMEVIDARAKRDETHARVQAAQAAVESATLNLGYTTVTAPISGRMSRRLVDVGNLVGDGKTTLLANLVEVDPVYVYCYVSEKNLLKYMREYGHTADVADPGEKQVEAWLALSGESGFPHKGVIDYADNQVDPSTGTIQIRGEFPNPDRKLVPGLFARVQIELGKPYQALLVPDRCIVSSQQGQYVYVVDANNTVRRQPVETGQKVDTLREIVSGLSADDSVVIEGLLRVRPGATVSTKPYTEHSGTSGTSSSGSADGSLNGKKPAREQSAEGTTAASGSANGSGSDGKD